MMFRAPIDTQAESHDFYNDGYEQGFTTDMPAEAELQSLKAKNFAGSTKDYTRYIASLFDIGVGPGAKIFDFGCSWGYGSYQFRTAGFDVTSSEVSKPRGGYARDKLGVNLVEFDSFAPKNSEQYDVFFSAHVLEHVPSPSAVIATAMSMLKPGGLFVAYFPNGSAACRASEPEWSKHWGEVHPNMVDEVFLNRVFTDHTRIFASQRYDHSGSRAKQPAFTGFREAASPATFYSDDLSKIEMFVAVRK